MQICEYWTVLYHTTSFLCYIYGHQMNWDVNSLNDCTIELIEVN